jgi:magnesium-transporting ATPase (P-type)
LLHFLVFLPFLIDLTFHLAQIGMDFYDMRSKSSVIHVFPFNSEKKRGAVAVEVI